MSISSDEEGTLYVPYSETFRPLETILIYNEILYQISSMLDLTLEKSECYVYTKLWALEQNL